MADLERKQTSEPGRHTSQRFGDSQTIAFFKKRVEAQMASNENIISLIDRRMELLDAQSFAHANAWKEGLFEENPNYCPPERIAAIQKNLDANHVEMRSAQSKTDRQTLTGFADFRASIFGADYQFEQSSEDGEEEIDERIFLEIDERIPLSAEKAIRQSQNEPLAALHSFLTRIEDGATHGDSACRTTLWRMAAKIRTGVMNETLTVEMGNQILAAEASSGLDDEFILNNVYGLEYYCNPSLQPSAIVQHYMKANTPRPATVRVSTHRAPHRARRTSAGHGAAAKAGDDGDGDGDGDGEPPRRSHTPTPPLRHSLAHSLISGGAQW